MPLIIASATSDKEKLNFPQNYSKILAKAKELDSNLPTAKLFDLCTLPEAMNSFYNGTNSH